MPPGLPRPFSHLQEVQLAEGGHDEPVGRPPPAVNGLHHGVQDRPDDLRVLHVDVEVHVGLGEGLLLEHLLEGRHVVLEPLPCLREGQVLDPLAFRVFCVGGG